MDFLLLGLVSFLIAVVYLVYMCWHFRVFTLQGIPVPTTCIPVFGTILPVLTQGSIEASNGFLEKYGKTYGGFSGRIPALATVDSDIIKQVFIKDHAAFPHRFPLVSGDERNDGMLQNITDYEHWKYLRSIMSPTFSSGKLRNMMTQINKCAAVSADHLTSESGSLDITEFAGSFSVDAIASTAFGLDINTRKDRNNPFVLNAKKAFEIRTWHPLLLTSLFAPFLIPFVKLFKISFFDPKSLDFFENIANQALDAREKDNSGQVDYLQLLQNAHQETGSQARSLSRREIICQAVLFFIAGYDTTAITISYLAYNLALNPDKQEKLLEEVERIVGKKDVILDEDLSQMPYLEMCIHESMRLYPPAPVIDRVANQDVVVNGIKLPKGSSVIVPVYHMHRLAELYPEPDKFLPERFSSEERAKRDNLSFMPFGAGPRQCIASRLALLEVKIAILHILKTHRFTVAPETERPPKFRSMGLLKPINGVWLRVEARSNIQ